MHPAGIEALGLQQPPLDHPSIRRGELVALGLGDVAIAQPWVQVGDPSLGALHHDVQLARVARVRRAKGKDARGAVEVKDSPRPARFGPHVALEVARVKRRNAGAAGKEVQATSILRPAQAHAAVAAAHVGDQAVADRLVERECQAVRNAAGGWHNPQALDQAGIEAVGGHEGDDIASGGPRGGAQVKTASQLVTAALQVDQVEVELALQV